VISYEIREEKQSLIARQKNKNIGPHGMGGIKLL